MDVYAENILDHYRHPRHKTVLPDATVTHEEKNLNCGDTLTVQLTIADQTIQSVGWQGEGCAISQAAMSILSEELEGKSAEEISRLNQKDIYTLLGVPIGPRRYKCALLCLHTLKNAINLYQKMPVQGWIRTVEVEGN